MADHDAEARGLAAQWARARKAEVEGDKRAKAKATNPLSPACTPKEWRDRLSGRSMTIRCSDDSDLVDRHREAAFALWGQPYGFTREDWRMLSRVKYLGLPLDIALWLNGFADRIESLLPPEPTP
jgi:hypothetical protein